MSKCRIAIPAHKTFCKQRATAGAIVQIRASDKNLSANQRKKNNLRGLRPKVGSAAEGDLRETLVKLPRQPGIFYVRKNLLIKVIADPSGVRVRMSGAF
jgi:hypothetical protein